MYYLLSCIIILHFSLKDYSIFFQGFGAYHGLKSFTFCTHQNWYVGEIDIDIYTHTYTYIDLHVVKLLIFSQICKKNYNNICSVLQSQ